MFNEIDVFGIYVSPILICIVSAFLLRVLLSSIMQRVGLYNLISHKPIFDTALFVSLTGLIFNLLAVMTAPNGYFLS